MALPLEVLAKNGEVAQMVRASRYNREGLEFF